MKYLFVLTLFLCSLFCQGQEKKHGLGLSYGFGEGDIGSGRDGVGGVGLIGKSIRLVGLNYWYGFNKHLQLETGIHYLKHKYTVAYPFHPPNTKAPTDHQVQLISLPIKLKYEIGKYFFFNGGFDIDIDISKHTRFENTDLTGIGVGAGLGIQYPFENGLGIYINPQFDLRNLSSLSRYDQKVFRAGLVSFGLNYRFK